VTFGILGPLNVHDPAGTPVPVRRRKARTLLAALLCHRGREIPATQLVEWLWDTPPASASANLHSYISELRRALAAAGSSAALHTGGRGYQLSVRTGSVDADRFAELAAAGAQALSQGAAALAAHHLGQAASMWRGEPLDGVPLPESARSYLEGLVGCRLEVLANLARARVEIGLNNEASDGLNFLPAPPPGNQSGIQLRRSPHASATVGAAPRRTPRQLPAPPDSFVGRNAEMIALEHAALRAHLVAVVGGPGAGKTALTLAWAEQASESYPDGQLYVHLGGHTGNKPLEPREALRQLLFSLDVILDERASEAQLAAALRTALTDRRMLIVLDDALDAFQVRPLLPGPGECLAVVTCRNRLDDLVVHEGARRLRVGRLSPAGTDALIESTGVPAYRHVMATSCDRSPLALRAVAADPLRRPLEAADQTVRRAFDVSYVRLCPAEQHFFRSLSVLPERAFTVTQVAAALTMAPARTEDFLDRLDQAGLVQRCDAFGYELAPMAHQYISALAADEIPKFPGQGGRPGRRSFHRSDSGGLLPGPWTPDRSVAGCRIAN
jgi:hypothetical protein